MEVCEIIYSYSAYYRNGAGFSVDGWWPRCVLDVLCCFGDDKQHLCG